MPEWFKKILDVFLPPRCLLCGKILSGENGLCEECFAKINFIGAPYCHKCGHPLPAGTNAVSCARCVSDDKNPFRMQRARVCYDEGSRPLLINFKFFDKTENAAFLARWLYAAAHDILEAGADVLIPVPLHHARLRHRRYNQAALLCKELGKLSGLPVDYTALVRHKNTKPQVECSASTRVHNVKNAFSVKHPERIAGRRIILIDDVMTTGSTLKECGMVLLASGAQSVDALTVAAVIQTG